MLTVVPDPAGRDSGGSSSLIDEIVREGARRMLAEALQAEVDAYITAHAAEREEDGRRLVVRNGCHQSREVLTSAGAIEVTVRRVNDKRTDPATGERKRFRSAIVPPWARKTPKITEVLPLLYLHGLSSGDFVPALGQFLGSAAGLSAAVITRLTEQWQAEQRAFAARDLSAVDYVYLWADGIHVNIRLEEHKLCLLVLIGVRADGRKELIALADGYRESAESWADLLRDCARRGMRAPVLAVGDGALGFWNALREVFPQAREGRCWFHKTANVLAALPKSAHPGAKKALAEIWGAEDKDHARAAAKAFGAAYGAKFPRAAAKIRDDAEELLAFYDYPAEHWVHLRTTNPIVIWSPAEGVHDVCDEPLTALGLRPGRGYLMPVRHAAWGGPVFVQRVAGSGSRGESWTVLGRDGRPVEAVDRYLAYLSDIDRSPNTVRAYAHDLKDWFTFLADGGLDWRSVRLEDVGAFVAWLRLPAPARSGDLAVLPSVPPACAEVTVNRKLSALAAFYQHAARLGVDPGELLTAWAPAGRRGSAWRPFLHHVSKGKPRRGRQIRLKAQDKQPRVLSPAEVQAILDACQRLRDRFLFALLYDSGMRIGEALGLRHEDWDAAACQVTVMARRNDNRARSKSAQPRTIPVSAALVRLYGDYLHGEYGDLDSDYVFVNLWAVPHGHPLTYPAVYDLVRRLRQATGIWFDPHWFRHSYATRLLRCGTPVEVVSRLLGHVSVSTTEQVYSHLTVEDARRVLEQAGWFAQAPVRL